MQLNVLRYFLEVSRHGSVRKAAEHIHITPSAVSRHIAILEGMIGAPLFERRSRGMVLTPEGEILFKYADRIIGNLDIVKCAVGEIRGMKKGILRIFAIEAVASSILYPAIRDFIVKHSGVTIQVDVVGRDNNDVVHALVRDEADLGIMFRLNRNAEIDYLDEFDMPFVALAAPGHPLAARSSISVRDLADTLVGGLPPSSASRSITDDVMRSLGTQIRYTLTVNSMEMAKEFARTGVGIAILPSVCAQEECKTGALVAVPFIEWGLQTVRATVCGHRGREPSAAAKAFLDILKTYYLPRSDTPAHHPPATSAMCSPGRPWDVAQMSAGRSLASQ
ncbi:bacterial regulatory helix-turn-helix, lysR family protein [Paraburkholderia xenovorans LB400]|uniref:Transcriptional regulator, LysR family n=1 Tax=Paraburkholderia xenovorans (strain LB400) TaxID=266265 RepID=Q13GF1_PARXL|nr:LysR family transcriptional regulator [Paraburkholderia xenovorans]ABE36838.1 transcriptional regulator, LysR family [Paraburkholderia xenovorans LB400]AIP34343.1 bacterial regulatory helix-turn-helix, lysR family protein [Paraburkholderia xenovorans LB400]